MDQTIQPPLLMNAMVLEQSCSRLLHQRIPVPIPSPYQVLIKVAACAICRTDLHIIDGDLKQPKLPLVPGHQIVGEVISRGTLVTDIAVGQLVGVSWLGYTCGDCGYCRKGLENLCDHAQFTGYHLDGGYAEYAVADHRYCFPLPMEHGGSFGAPLLCAGLTGYRSYTMLPTEAKNIGIYGFGGAGHILIQVAINHGKSVCAFTRPGDHSAQEFARRYGAAWAGDSTAPAPFLLDAAIIFAPVGELVVKALQDTVKGGTIICGGIHMSDIPSLPYQLLWGERSIKSVANLTRKDGQALLALARELSFQTQTHPYPLHQANEALDHLRNGDINGVAVLIN
ncbi:zinc-dependent alcohol dehydrogenase family protein [Chitinophaga jiangningensis]|nr:zinc-dependent alcohol dehydrogenase family protein [Chitinophaga jiangningensis]